MSDEKEVVVICGPWGQKRVPSVMVKCRRCDKLLALSRQVRKELPTAVVECYACGSANADPDEPLRLPQSARKEVAARLGFDPGPVADRSLVEWARRQP